MFILSFTLLLITGFLSASVLLPDRGLGERAAMSFPLGMGMITLSIWGLIFLGMNLSPGLLVFFQAAIAGSLFYFSALKGDFKWDAFLRVGNLREAVHPGMAVLFLLFAAGLVCNFFYPVMVSDGVVYKVLGKVMVSEQKLRVIKEKIGIDNDEIRTLGFHFVSGYCHLFNFKYLKVVQSFFYMSLLGLFYFSIREFIDKDPSWGLTLLLASSPMVWWHSILYLNNLSTGFYFFCGTLYWFLSIHYNRQHYLLPASVFFMLAAWTRYETIIFFLIPLAFTFFLSIKEREKNGFLYLLLFPMILSGLWALFSLVYYPEMGRSYHYLYIFFGFISWGLLFLFIYEKNFSVESILKLSVVLLLSGIALGFLLEPVREKVVAVLPVIMAKTFGNILIKAGWGPGILLALLIPVFYSSYTSSQKALFFNLLMLFFGIIIFLSIWSGRSQMLGKSFMEGIKHYIVNAGTVVSRTSNREYFIFFPSFFFLLGTTLFKKGTNYGGLRGAISRFLRLGSIFNGLNVLIIGNLVMVSIFILFPRMDFFKTHFGLSHEQILKTMGARDNPNIYGATYKIAFAVSRVTSEDSVIFFPPPSIALDVKKKGFDPYNAFGIYQAVDVLYPRGFYWSDPESANPEKFAGKNVFQVTNANWLENRCKGHPESIYLDYGDWFICPESF